MYVNRCRFTPQEALCSATSKTADRFRLADRGKIEEGRLADLLLVAGNPAESIDAIVNVQGVWRNGERLSSMN
jgi:imidazolonepropionase-like amidohydrolase